MLIPYPCILLLLSSSHHSLAHFHTFSYTLLHYLWPPKKPLSFLVPSPVSIPSSSPIPIPKQRSILNLPHSDTHLPSSTSPSLIYHWHHLSKLPQQSLHTLIDGLPPIILHHHTFFPVMALLFQPQHTPSSPSHSFSPSHAAPKDTTVDVLSSLSLIPSPQYTRGFQPHLSLLPNNLQLICHFLPNLFIHNTCQRLFFLLPPRSIHLNRFFIRYHKYLVHRFTVTKSFPGMLCNSFSHILQILHASKILDR